LWQWIADISAISQGREGSCLHCRHFYRRIESGIMSCEAFPHGIPDEILFGITIHTRPYADDNGILFEPIPLIDDPDE